MREDHGDLIRQRYPDIPRRVSGYNLDSLLGVAKRRLRHTIDVLAHHVRADGLVVGLERDAPRVFRSDATELFPADPDVNRLRNHTVTLSELLTEHTDGWQPPRVETRALAQVHCHQHAVLGWDADSDLLEEPVWTCNGSIPVAAASRETSVSPPGTGRSARRSPSRRFCRGYARPKPARFR